MIYHIYLPPHSQGPADHIKAGLSFAEGLLTHGIKPVVFPLDGIVRHCDVAVVFGRGKHRVPASWPREAVIRNQVAHQRPYILLEKGFVKRDEYFHVGWNGHNNNADFRNEGSPPDRWEKLGVELKPWDTGGDTVLLCGQVPWDSTVEHTDHRLWLRETYRALIRLSDAKVVFRPHPLGPSAADIFEGNLSEVSLSDKDLEADFARAWSIVTYNSTVGTDAAIAGKPVFVENDASMAWPVANRDILDIDVPKRIERQQWANDLAYAQWTLAEMESGECWEHLK